MAGSISQTYDRAARVATEARSLANISGDPGSGTQTFAYDNASRVTGSSGLTKTYSYTYDLDGDRLTRSDGVISTSFTYDRTSQLSTQTIGGTQKSFVYDTYGNLTTAADDQSALTNYAYDKASRLTGITPATGSAATFTIDALDRPKSRTVGAATDNYGYVAASSTAYETGTATTDALLDLDGTRLAVKTGGTVSWVVFDLHGSIVALCPAGTTSLSDAYRYDPWGQPITTGSTVNPWRYRGLLDVSPNSTPVDAMGARFYSPGLGAFTQQDSVQGQAADPLSMNRYLYAEANPATLIDPDGHAVPPTELLCSDYQDFCRTSSGGTTVNEDAIAEPVPTGGGEGGGSTAPATTSTAPPPPDYCDLFCRHAAGLTITSPSVDPRRCELSAAAMAGGAGASSLTCEGFRSGADGLSTTDEQTLEQDTEACGLDLGCLLAATLKALKVDYVSLSGTGVVPVYLIAGPAFTVGVTATRTGNTYFTFGVGGGVGFGGRAAELRAGNILECDRSCDVDQFVSGWSATASGLAPVYGPVGPSGGGTWGQVGSFDASAFSYEYGLGIGTPGASLTGSYSWQLPMTFSGW